MDLLTYCLGPSYLSDALSNLHEAIIKATAGGRQGTSEDLSPREVESAQSVGYWLHQTGLLEVPEDSGYLHQQEKDSMKLQISLLHQQLEDKNRQILGMQSAVQQLQQQQRQLPPNPSELSLLKSEVERLQKENSELRQDLIFGL